MTVRTTAMQTCDRCMKPFNERYLKTGEAVPVFKQKGLVITSTTGTSKDPEPKYTVLFTFEDMCPDCQKVVSNLLDKLRLDGKPAAKTKRRGPAKKRSPKKKDAETTEEYTETPKVETKDSGAEETKDEETKDDGAGEEKKAPEPPSEEAKGDAEERPAEAKAETSEENSGGNGTDVKKEDLIEDPETGDLYDKNTGEVVVRASAGDAGKAKHPF